ncbi:MAG: hypothetical protein RLZZ461_953 [Planctomycetota bacterium]|jgi:hypothetical protein
MAGPGPPGDRHPEINNSARVLATLVQAGWGRGLFLGAW